jgi:glycine/D-amino acid oxidase-like deaminating enzyme
VIAALERGINSFRRLPLAQVQRLAGSERHLEGWFSPAAATVQPGKLVRGLRRVALQRGVRIHEGTAMTGLEHGAPAQVRPARCAPTAWCWASMPGWRGPSRSSSAAWRSFPATW